MPITRALLFFCENCKTVSLDGGICQKCETPLQFEYFVPEAIKDETNTFCDCVDPHFDLVETCSECGKPPRY